MEGFFYSFFLFGYFTVATEIRVLSVTIRLTNLLSFSSRYIRYEESIIKAEPYSIEEPAIFQALEKLEDTTDALLIR